jgi:Leucine-rich repeat (LRR) protein
MRSALLVLVACAHAAPPRPIAHAPATALPRWPVPVRVMTWTTDGVVEVGELPDAPPAVMPTTAWYVEPTRPLDAAAFDRLIVAVRTEHVPGLSLRGQAIAASRLGHLTDLPELKALVLDDTDVIDPGAVHLALARIYLARTPVDDAALARLAAAQPALEVLDVEDCAIGDAAAHAIATLRSLRALDLAGTRIGDAGGGELGALHQLEILDLGRTQIAARTIAAIRPLALRELFVDGTRAGHELATLDGYAPGLVRFDASNLAAYKPTDADLGWLANAPNLVEVAISGAQVHDPLALALAALPGLRVLRLADTPITIATIRAIAKRKELEELDLASTPVDNASAATLIALPKLRMLRLDGTPIGDAGLSATPGPALAELYVSRTKVDDAGTALLEAAPGLVALGLGDTQIGDLTIERVARLSRLRTLVLSSTHASMKALVRLGALHELERLYLEHTETYDEVIAALAPAHRLRVLHLEGSDISDDALPVLRTFGNLRELTVGDTRLGAIALALDAWPRLRTLSLLGLAIDDAALAELAHHAQIETLDISATEVTNPEPLAALPHLRVLGIANLQLAHAGEQAAAQLAARGVEIVR